MATHTELFRTSYGVALAALRGDTSAVQTLLDGLTAHETAHVAQGALCGLADGLRMLATPEQFHEMTAALQALAHEEAVT